MHVHARDRGREGERARGGRRRKEGEKADDTQNKKTTSLGTLSRKRERERSRCSSRKWQFDTIENFHRARKKEGGEVTQKQREKEMENWRRQRKCDEDFCHVREVATIEKEGTEVTGERRRWRRRGRGRRR